MRQLAITGQADRGSDVPGRAERRFQQPAAISKLQIQGCMAITGWLSFLIGALLLLPGAAVGQESRGTISGTIVDSSGAVVPGASIVVQEAHTGSVSRTTSDRVGQYAVPFLLPGDYSITVTKPEFEALARNGIELQAQDHPVMNLTLTVGSESQTVTVAGGAPLLNQENASIGEVISTQSVSSLPLNGRTPVVLAQLTVGVTASMAPQILHPFDAQWLNSWTIGGTPIQMTESLLDGAPNLFLSGGVAYSPTQDSVQEVSVRPFDTDASYGHTIAGVVNMITKGGTNGFHGSAYEFSALSDLNANLYFNDRETPIPPTPVAHFNQYGLTVGGPVLIPKVFDGRNKLFFFFAWEGVRDETAETAILSVPTDAEKEGDFHALLAGGPSYQLYEPNTGTLNGGTYTRTPVPNNCLTNQSSYCASVANAGISVNPIAVNYMKLFPEPNSTSGVSPITNQDNYNSNAPYTDTYSNEFGRLDYNLSVRDHAFFDFRHNSELQNKNNYFKNNSTGSNLYRQNWGATLDNVFTFNPTTVVDVRLNWTFFSEGHTNPAAIYSPSTIGFPSNIQSSAEYVELPTINFSGYQGFASNSAGQDPTTIYQAFGDVLKLAGRHTLKMGFDGRQYRQRIQTYGDASGLFTFGTNFVTCGTGCSAQPFGGDMASFEYGLPTSGEFDLNALADYRAYYIASFLQDDWRVSNSLMINLGLRYDVGTPFGEKFGRTVNGFSSSAVNSASTAAATAFIPLAMTVNDTTVSVSSINTLGGLTFPSSDWGAPYQIEDKTGSWSPRVGFSYNPSRFKKTAVHGGFGIFVQPQNLTIGNSDSSSFQEGFSASTAYAATTNNYFTNASSLSNPFPGGFTRPAGASLGASTFLGSPSAISFWAPVEHDQYSERWTLGVQQEVTSSTLVELLYEGNHAVHLTESNNINAIERQYMTTSPYANMNLVKAVGTAVQNPFAGLLPNGTSSYNGATTSLGNLLVPYPAFGSAAITEVQETGGQMYYNSGMFHLEQRAKHGLTLTVNYNFSKFVEADTFLNPEDVKPERRVSPLEHKQLFKVGAVYELPFGRGKQFSFGGSKLLDEIAGGWVLNGIYQYESGAPITFTGDIPLQPGMTVKDIRSSPRNTSPTGSGNPALTNAASVFVTGSSSSCTVSAGQPCDGTAFFNAQYTDHYRTLPTTIGSVRQDGFNNLDASLLKNFKFTEKSYLQLRFETFNTLNHPIFGTPNLTPTASNFGYITSVYNQSQPRQVQLGARFAF